MLTRGIRLNLGSVPTPTSVPQLCFGGSITKILYQRVRQRDALSTASSDALDSSIQFHWNMPAVPGCMYACFWAS